jgi:hypothetical protein
VGLDCRSFSVWLLVDLKGHEICTVWFLVGMAVQVQLFNILSSPDNYLGHLGRHKLLAWLGAPGSRSEA